MMIRSIAGAAAAVVLLSDCSPRPKQAATDREVLQSPAAAAVLKHVLGECPRRKEVRGLTITIGEKMEQAEAEFEKQFNAPDLPVFHYRRLVVGAAAGKVRIFDESTGIAPLILQISSLTAPVDGRREAVAAWSWQEEAERHRYEVVEQADGGFAVKTLEAIPIAPRNADPKSRDAEGAR